MTNRLYTMKTISIVGVSIQAPANDIGKQAGDFVVEALKLDFAHYLKSLSFDHDSGRFLIEMQPIVLAGDPAHVATCYHAQRRLDGFECLGQVKVNKTSVKRMFSQLR